MQGSYSLLHTYGGAQSLFLGYRAGNFTNTGAGNTGLGYLAGFSLTSGEGNAIVGAGAAENNTTGTGNVAVGFEALKYNATAGYSVGIGYQALRGESGYSPGFNIAVGPWAQYKARAGGYNIALGIGALYNSTNAVSNIAIGSYSLYSATADAFANVLIGDNTGRLLTGSGLGGNIAIGYDALYYGETSTGNVAVGFKALKGASGYSPQFNVAIGTNAGEAVTTGQNNLFIGYSAGTVATNAHGNTALGYQALAYAKHSGYNAAIGASTARSIGAVQTAGAFSVGRSYVIVSAGTTDFVALGAADNNPGTQFMPNAAGSGTGTAATVDNLNTAIGAYAMYDVVAGIRNVAIGYESLYGATASCPDFATAVGFQALKGATSSAHSGNTAIGYQAGVAVTSGSNNTLVGKGAGDSLTTGAGNILIGVDADAPAASTDNYLNIGGLILGDLSAKYLGIDVAPSSTTTLNLPASTTGKAPVRLAHGVAPTTPTDGDVWTTTAGMYVRINGVTIGPLAARSDVDNIVAVDDSVAADKSRVVVGYLELAAAFEVAGNVEVL